MSYKSDKLKSLWAYTAFVTAIAMIIGLCVSIFTGHTHICVLAGLGVGILYFLVGLWAIHRIEKIILLTAKDALEQIDFEKLKEEAEEHFPGITQK